MGGERILARACSDSRSSDLDSLMVIRAWSLLNASSENILLGWYIANCMFPSSLIEVGSCSIVKISGEESSISLGNALPSV